MVQRGSRLIWGVLGISAILTIGLWIFPVFMVHRGEQRNYEMTAIRSLVLLNTAQKQHFAQNKTYAATLQQLGTLIPEDLSKGSRFGYIFRLTADQPTTYHLYATPTTYGETGRRSFYTDATLVIRESTDRDKPAGPTSPEIR